MAGDSIPERLLDALYPTICNLCHHRFLQSQSPFTGICRSCLQQLPIRKGEERLIRLRASEDDRLTAICACYYEGAIRRSLIRMKFSDAPEACEAFAALLADAIQRTVRLPGGCAVAAVPLHPLRERERGYNQAALIAGALARRLLLPDFSGGLSRHRRTGRQSELKTLPERRDNVSNAFFVTNPTLFFGRHILLVDDILSTGATILSAREALLQAGASSVLPVAVASGESKMTKGHSLNTDSEK